MVEATEDVLQQGLRDGDIVVSVNTFIFFLSFFFADFHENNCIGLMIFDVIIVMQYCNYTLNFYSQEAFCI